MGVRLGICRRVEPRAELGVIKVFPQPPINVFDPQVPDENLGH
jgi:hypothetical protein